MKKLTILTLLFGCALAGSGFLAEVAPVGGIFIKGAEARVGRPLTPVSYAGVARRTTRRTIARTSVYVATLPGGCQRVVISGANVYQCGATYYQPSGGQYVVVNVQ